MKTRNGFVSNSSSSSFILRTTGIGSVASHMLEVVLRDSRNWDEDDIPKKMTKEQKKLNSEREVNYRLRERNLKKALQRQDVKDGKIGITMPSCNYDTYILKVDDLVYVSTCNNHSWVFDHICNEDYAGGGEDDGDYDKVHDVIKKAFFYNIKNGLIHSSEKHEEDEKMVKFYCNSCKVERWSYVETLKGEMLCSYCYHWLGKTPEKVIEELREESQKNMSAIKYLEP